MVPPSSRESRAIARGTTSLDAGTRPFFPDGELDDPALECWRAGERVLTGMSSIPRWRRSPLGLSWQPNGRHRGSRWVTILLEPPFNVFVLALSARSHHASSNDAVACTSSLSRQISSRSSSLRCGGLLAELRASPVPETDHSLASSRVAVTASSLCLSAAKTGVCRRSARRPFSEPLRVTSREALEAFPRPSETAERLRRIAETQTRRGIRVGTRHRRLGPRWSTGALGAVSTARE